MKVSPLAKAMVAVVSLQSLARQLGQGLMALVGQWRTAPRQTRKAMMTMGNPQASRMGLSTDTVLLPLL